MLCTCMAFAQIARKKKNVEFKITEMLSEKWFQAAFFCIIFTRIYFFDIMGMIFIEMECNSNDEYQQTF